MSADVVSIRPKTLNKTFKGQKYKIIYNVETKKWDWEVTFVSTTRATGSDCKTLNVAQKQAEQHIMRLMGE